MSSPRTLRMTKQRKVILEELQRVNSHPSANQVYGMVRRRLPRISLGTVYRNLEALCGCGLINKIDLGDGQRRYDATKDDHYHVRCVRCSRVGDIRIDPEWNVIDEVHEASGYEVTGYRLDFVGLCQDCKMRGGDA